MKGKIIVIGALTFLLHSGMLYTLEIPLEKQTLEEVQLFDKFYNEIELLSTSDIEECLKENLTFFVDKYKDYANQELAWNSTLDAKVFEAAGNIFNMNKILIEETSSYLEKNKDKEAGLVSIHSKHAFFLTMYKDILDNSEDKNPLEIMNKIYRVTKDKLQFKKFSDNLVSCNLDHRELDTFQLAVIYADIAKELKLPFSIVRANDNFMVQYGDAYLFPYNGYMYTKQEIVEWLDLDTNSLESRLYLKPLTQDDLLAVTFARKGWRRFGFIQSDVNELKGKETSNYKEKVDKKLLEETLADFERSLNLDNNNIDTFYYRGLMFYLLGTNFGTYPDESFEQSLTLLEEPPFWDMKYIDLAIQDYYRLAELDPTRPQGHALLGTAFYDKAYAYACQADEVNTLHFRQQAINAFRKAFELDKSVINMIPKDIKAEVISMRHI